MERIEEIAKKEMKFFRERENKNDSSTRRFNDTFEDGIVYGLRIAEKKYHAKYNEDNK